MKNKRLQKYLVRTFLISWISWIVLAILVKNNIVTFASIIGTIIFIIGGFGPTIAAISVLEEKITIKSVVNYIFSHKKKTLLYLLLICVLDIAVFGLSSMEMNVAIPLFMIPLMFIQTILIGGGNEELGWRGVMQPILEKEISFPVATLITGGVWALWHLPLWFIEGTTQQSFPFIVFVVYVIVLSFWLAWLYKKTNSIFYCCILHGLSNLVLSLFVLKVNAIFIIGLVGMTILSIVTWNKDFIESSN